MFSPNVQAKLVQTALCNDIKYLDLLLERRQRIIRELASVEASIHRKEVDIANLNEVLKSYYCGA